MCQTLSFHDEQVYSKISITELSGKTRNCSSFEGINSKKRRSKRKLYMVWVNEKAQF